MFRAKAADPRRAAFAFRDGWDKQGAKAGRPVEETQAFRRGSDRRRF